MTEQTGDGELIAAVRAGDDHAFAQLYVRHRPYALRFARSLTGRSGDAEDLVADAFARVLAAIKSGNGPTEAFRPYLLSSVRNLYLNHARHSAREQPMAEPAGLLPPAPPVDPVVIRDEGRLVATAFSQLPERWQAVLWHTAVEGETPAQVGALLGLNANAAAALAYRAREGLRERYLQAHLASATDARCQPTVDRLGAYLRNRLSRAEAQRVREHLDGCDRCRMLFVDLGDVNSRLGALLGPVVLGGAAAAYLASHAATAAGISTPVAAALAVTAAVTVAVVAVAAGPGLTPTAVGPQPTSSRTGSAHTGVTPGTDATSGTVPTGTVPTGTVPTGTVPTGTATEIEPFSAPSVGTATEEPIALLADIEIGLFDRGLPGQVLLSVTNPSSGPKRAGVDLTATLSVPTGVTLNVASAGNGWTCESVEQSIICQRPNLWPGRSTRAVIHVRVSPDAESGPVSALVSGPGAAPIMVSTPGLA